MTCATPGAEGSAPPLPTEGARKQGIVGLQYLRGIAALLVVFSHINGLVASRKYFGREIHPVLSAGSVGVDLFFVISGFIIAYVTLERRTLRPIAGRGAFFAKRFSRVVPFMWICIVGELVLRLMGRSVGDLDLWPYVNAAFLVPLAELRPNQIWTLRHEALFYLIVGLTILTSPRLRPLLALWFISPFIYWPLRDLLEDGSTAQRWCDFLFGAVKVEFALGYVYSCYLLEKGGLPTFPVRFPVTLLLLLCGGLTAYAWYFDLSDYSLFTIATIAPFATLIVILSTVIRPGAGWVDRLWQLIGNASYSIYLTHTSIISAVLGFWARRQPGANLLVVMAALLVVVLIGGVLVHLWIEKPVIRLSSAVVARLMHKSKQQVLPQQATPAMPYEVG